MTVREFIRAHAERLHAKEGMDRARAVMEATGCSYDRAYRLLKAELDKTEDSGSKPPSPAAVESRSLALSRQDLMKKYDPCTKTREAIRAAVTQLKDDDEVLPSSFFLSSKCAGANPSVFRQVAAESEFEPYQFRVGEQIFWSTPGTKEWALKTLIRARDI